MSGTTGQPMPTEVVQPTQSNQSGQLGGGKGPGQPMPTEFAQPGQTGGDKGTGRPTQTAMGTPIVYGKSYLNTNQYSQGNTFDGGPLSNSYSGYSDYNMGGDSGVGDSGVSDSGVGDSGPGGSSGVGGDSGAAAGPGDGSSGDGSY